MMTRDAKIGLLVALAFILIVGILLSEHVTTLTTPTQAPLAVAGEKVRVATHAPVTPAPVLERIKIDPNPQPQIAVATRDQLDAPQPLPPTSRIELGQPASGQIAVIRVDAPADPAKPVDPIAGAIGVKPTVTPVPASVQTTPTMLGSNTIEAADAQLVEKPIHSNVPQNLAEVAKQNGAELVAVGAPAAKVETTGRIPNGARVKEYVAQPGDTLAKMAGRLLGANTPANCQAIVALNAPLQKNSDRVIVGAKYLIPADAWAAALRVNDEPAAPVAKVDAKVDAKPTTAAPAATTATVLYNVQAGDSLWKIAQREVGTRGAVAQIKQLNPAAFADGETVKVGMTLKLPVKAKA